MDFRFAVVISFQDLFLYKFDQKDYVSSPTLFSKMGIPISDCFEKDRTLLSVPNSFYWTQNYLYWKREGIICKFELSENWNFQQKFKIGNFGIQYEHWFMQGCLDKIVVFGEQQQPFSKLIILNKDLAVVSEIRVPVEFQNNISYSFHEGDVLRYFPDKTFDIVSFSEIFTEKKNSVFTLPVKPMVEMVILDQKKVTFVCNNVVAFFCRKKHSWKFVGPEKNVRRVISSSMIRSISVLKNSKDEFAVLEKCSDSRYGKTAYFRVKYFHKKNSTAPERCC
jgi:hypothetical protein